MLTLLVPSSLRHVNEFGNLGLHSAADSLYGWQSRIDVGHPIDWLNEGCRIPMCTLCDQEEETIQHILVSCVFTRQVW
jgi:hypothetical protein